MNFWLMSFCFFNFGFGYATQGYSLGARKFGCTKIAAGFHQYFALRNISLLQDLVFPSVIFNWL